MKTSVDETTDVKCDVISVSYWSIIFTLRSLANEDDYLITMKLKEKIGKH